MVVPVHDAEPVTPGEILAVIYGQGLGDARFGLPVPPDVEAVYEALVLEPRYKAAIFRHVRKIAAVPPEPRVRRGGSALRFAAVFLLLGGVLLGVSVLTGKIQWPNTTPLVGAAADNPSALLVLRIEASLGNPAAEEGLGELADSHWRTSETTLPKDDAQAFAWYLAAAKAGNAVAANSAAYDYQSGYGVAQDNFLAAEWYRTAADEGLATAQTTLGYFYQEGVAVAQSDALAAGWYSRGAAQGDASGENALGFMYSNGRGVTKDLVQAQSWFQKSADQRFTPAMVNLGLLYMQGVQGSPDLVSAAKWFLLAQKYGDTQAGMALAALSGLTTPITPDQLTTAKQQADSWSGNNN
jgi:TPR repeat protein